MIYRLQKYEDAAARCWTYADILYKVLREKDGNLGNETLIYEIEKIHSIGLIEELEIL